MSPFAASHSSRYRPTVRRSFTTIPCLSLARASSSACWASFAVSNPPRTMGFRFPPFPGPSIA